MIYCIEYAKPISQIEESLNDCPMIFPWYTDKDF